MKTITIIESGLGGFYLEGRNGVRPTEEEAREVAANILRETGGAVKVERISGLDETYEVKPRTADTGTCEIVSNEGGPVAAVIDGQRYRLRKEEPGDEVAVQEQTFGEYRVGARFNPEVSYEVARLKEKAAAFIDECNEQCRTIFRTGSGLHGELDRERAELYDRAMRDAEGAAMFAVKAATKQPMA